MNINAYAAYKAKEELKPYQYLKNLPGDYEVEVKITHCGICHSDIHLIDNDWMISSYPLVPGHEIVGEVKAIGKQVNHLKIGDRVGIGWQSGSCHNCEYCNAGQENLCSQHAPTCVGRPGGFADHIITDSRFAFLIPDKLSSENAAPLLCAGITVYSPLRIYGVQPTHKVGVIGIGGLGHLAIQFAAAFGCEVTAFSTSADKEEEARGFGAHHFINIKDSKQIKDARNSFDFIMSTVNVALNWADFVSMLKPNGRLNFVGANAEPMNISPVMLLSGQRTVSGSQIGGRAMMNEMFRFAALHNITAKTEVLPVADVNKAIEKVKNNKARYRMVLQM